MSAPAPARPTPGRAASTPLDAIVVLVSLAAALGAMLLFAAGRDQPLRQAPSGFDGLAIWLAEGGLDAQSFRGGWTIPAREVGLTVLPVYDAALDEARVAPATETELRLQRDEIDMDARTLREKVGMAPALLVLPKWRSGMRLTGVAHPDLLIDPADVSRLLERVLGRPAAAAGAIGQATAPFSDFAYRGADGRTLTARLPLARTFEGAGCRPEIGRPGAMILGLCPTELADGEGWVHVLSDPDLLNNHGLRLGDNARIARDLVGRLADGRRVIVDYSLETWLTAERGRGSPARTWADLARFLAFPFSLLWLGAGATLALFVWRGAVRAGPAADGEARRPPSRAAMLGARARLMRLTGQDGALVQAYAQARIGSTARRLLGPRGPEPAETAVLRLARRRDAALGKRLAALLGRIRAAPPDLPPEAAVACVDELEILLERLNDDA
ncbi:hypothetical protein [Albimonas pacifica]|uniref:DUF4350 domain-containing protein n=1 Tax=Albimonas pacifica TaxID=1114924 RepID=A0A1I3CHU4_9RHOB|nr:hypothetical protein [Albimonas pacifica]SFH74045.1 hypothetical protein SAMN05216258_1028 [Albimonas pacifica]